MASIIRSARIADVEFALISGVAGIPAQANGRGVAAAVSNSQTADLPPQLPEVIEPRVDPEALLAQRVKQLLATEREALETSWDEEAEKRYQAAIEKGYAKGMALAEEAVLVHRKELDERVDQLEEAICQSVAGALDNVERLAIEIALEAVRKILGRGVTSGEAVAAVVHEQLQHVGAEGGVLIRVNPKDFELLCGSPEPVVVTEKRVRYEADESVTRGGCIVESVRGIRDATLETQLSALTQILVGEVSAHPEAAQ